MVNIKYESPFDVHDKPAASALLRGVQSVGIFEASGRASGFTGRRCEVRVMELQSRYRHAVLLVAQVDAHLHQDQDHAPRDLTSPASQRRLRPILRKT